MHLETLKYKADEIIEEATRLTDSHGNKGLADQETDKSVDLAGVVVDEQAVVSEDENATDLSTDSCSASEGSSEPQVTGVPTTTSTIRHGSRLTIFQSLTEGSSAACKEAVEKEPADFTLQERPAFGFCLSVTGKSTRNDFEAKAFVPTQHFTNYYRPKTFEPKSSYVPKVNQYAF